MNKVSSGKLTVSHMDRRKLQTNFDKVLFTLKIKYEHALPLKEESKLHLLQGIETELVAYFNLFRDTTILRDYIEEMANLHDDIIKYKVEVFPTVYSFAADRFEKRFSFYTFK